MLSFWCLYCDGLLGACRNNGVSLVILKYTILLWFQTQIGIGSV
jgi:hypothetical protein